MNEYVTLLGAERVENAAHSISSAADRIANAASSFYDTAQRFITALDDHATRLERAAENQIPVGMDKP